MNETSWKLYTYSDEAWRAMYDDCAKATQSIDCELYIFSIDTEGRKFIDLFLKKAQEGVKIRLLCDAVGSYYFYASGIPEELRRAGIEVRFFNPVSPWRITNFTSNFFRDHKKILIIDGTIAHTGGVNIRNDMRFWRDTNMRIEGDLVYDLGQIFLRMWNIVRRGRFLPFKKPEVYVKHFALRTNAPHFRQRFMYNDLIENIRNAKKYVYLTTPYFVPDLRLLRVIRLAAKRGVDVRILMPEKSDHLYVDLAGQSYFTLLLKAGVKIFLFRKTMIHAKTGIIDDTWVTVGSMNLDSLSFRYNYEMNIVSEEVALIQEVKKQFEQDLRESDHVVRKDWLRRSFLQKFLELCTWPLHGIL